MYSQEPVSHLMGHSLNFNSVVEFYAEEELISAIIHIGQPFEGIIVGCFLYRDIDEGIIEFNQNYHAGDIPEQIITQVKNQAIETFKAEQNSIMEQTKKNSNMANQVAIRQEIEQLQAKLASLQKSLIS